MSAPRQTAAPMPRGGVRLLNEAAGTVKCPTCGEEHVIRALQGVDCACGTTITSEALGYRIVAVAPKGGDVARKAATLCADPRFQRFVQQEDETGARNYVLSFCGVRSRRLLDHDGMARRRFNEIAAEFEMWLQVP